MRKLLKALFLVPKRKECPEALSSFSLLDLTKSKIKGQQKSKGSPCICKIEMCTFTLLGNFF